MSYGLIEISVDDGKPIELLEITYSTSIWRYTTSERPVVFNLETFDPLPMRRGSISPTGDASNSNITIELSKDCPVWQLFLIQPPSELVIATLYSKHDQDADFSVAWKGRITNCEYADPWVKLNTESIFSSLQRVGIPRRYGASCPLHLYGSSCKAPRDNFMREGTVSAINGLEIVSGVAGGVDNDYFAGGYITWVNSIRGNLESRMISSSIGGVTGSIKMVARPMGLLPGQAIKIYAGCDHTLSECYSKFGNSVNFGGTPFIPQKNPFGGSTLY